MIKKDAFFAFFKEDNIAQIFEAREFRGEYFAGYGNYFSDLGLRENLDIDYYLYFDSGRYVIFVYERHSLYQDGEQYYVNPRFSGVIADNNRTRKLTYAIITDKKHEYKIPSWHNMPLESYFVQDEAAPLRLKTFEKLAEAKENAAEYSKSGKKTAVLGIYGEWDMY